MWRSQGVGARFGPSKRIQELARHKTSKAVWATTPRSPHSSSCEPNCPIWHVDPRTATAPVSPRVLQLSRPKRNHPDFVGNRQSSQSFVSAASKTATASQRVLCLALPRLKQSDICRNLGRPEEPVWRVSNSAKRATASPRLRVLAAPKPLSKDYLPPREPEWTRRNRS
ncbi:uncharacterized protein LOC128767282 [Synchiropus splendidus]|uniref:uncharacterized protein LOC128767282 n=1 Tax=Synchiropus splendidus TaxID=270530 RepID=UPI00237DCBD0|nr:uncharacterized protein LOC128767282 [Synchiropus splendidus]XP_053735196.1 uncharacterized protein LOC128767282 [Synchiropus splendidus]